MESIEFHGWFAEFDAQSNRAVYAQLPSGPDVCGCAECRNFTAARDRGLVYPAEVLELFDRLGIDPTRETEVFGMGHSPDYPELCLFGGWFNVVGRLVSDDWALPTSVTRELQLYPLAAPALVDPAFGDLSLFRIEFVVALPWLLDEPCPDIGAAL